MWSTHSILISREKLMRSQELFVFLMPVSEKRKWKIEKIRRKAGNKTPYICIYIDYWSESPRQNYFAGI